MMMGGSVSSSDPARAPLAPEPTIRTSLPRQVACERLTETLDALRKLAEREAHAHRPPSAELTHALEDAIEQLETYHGVLMDELSARTHGRHRYGTLVCEHVRRTGVLQLSRMRRLAQRMRGSRPSGDLTRAVWVESRVLAAETAALTADAAAFLGAR